MTLRYATVQNGWLAPDGTLHICAEYGHVFTAKDIYDDNADVRARCLALMREMLMEPASPPVEGMLTQALETLGYLKLATRYGKSDWYWHQDVKRITQAQADTLLALCAAQRKPWPLWVDRETGNIR